MWFRLEVDPPAASCRAPITVLTGPPSPLRGYGETTFSAFAALRRDGPSGRPVWTKLAEDFPQRAKSGADVQDRTGDLVLTKDALCQLSYIGLR